MPSFLTPAFLAGLLAVAIPVLVHLRMRERRVSQPFPSLMFVRLVPHKSLRRRTLQNLALFTARAFVVILLCVAFARPFFPVNASGARALGQTARVVALDVSASMGYEGVFPRAVAEAERAIREMGAANPVGLLVFSDQAQGLIPPSTDHEKALSALRDLAPVGRATRFAPALRLAGDWLGALKVDRREVIVITDGQAKALTGIADVSMPPNTQVSTRAVSPATKDNAAVTDVSVEPIKEADRSFAIVTARLIHQGRAPRRVTVTLEVAGRVIEEKTAVLPENGAASVTFIRAPLPVGLSKGRVRFTTDGLPVDDTFHFVLGAGGDVPVLLLDPSPYVARALEIGDQPSFDILRRSTLVAADLAGRTLVVLGDLGPNGLSPSAANALARFVEQGGGLLATTPLFGLRGDAAAMLPVAWGENVSRLTDRGASLGHVDLDHPALFAFKQARGSDFSRARFLQYRLLKPAPDPEGARLRVLARFDDGREALVEAAYGRGRVIAFTSPLDGLVSDLPVQPLFLPLIHELARHAAAHKATPLFHRVGDTVEVSGEPSSSADPIVALVRPGGRSEPLDKTAAGVELRDVGFHDVLTASGAPRIFAANLDSVESDLTNLDPEELEAALRPTGRSLEPAIAVEPAEAGSRQSWWRLALLAVAFLMLLETILGNAKGQKATS